MENYAITAEVTETEPLADTETTLTAESEEGGAAPTLDVEEKPETPPVTDYEAMASEDLAEIVRLIPAYADATHLGELPFARRFAELRDLGLSVKEALAAVHPRFERDTGKTHLRPSVQVGRTRATGAMSAEEMAAARELFGELGEKEIHALYRRVTRK